MSEPTEGAAAFERWANTENAKTEIAGLKTEMERILSGIKAVNDRLITLMHAVGAPLPYRQAPVSTDPRDPPSPAVPRPIREVSDHGIELPAPPTQATPAADDPPVYRDPPRWAGERMVGRKLSECSLPYLIALRDYKIWSIQNDLAKGTPKANDFAARDQVYLTHVNAWIARHQRPAQVGR